VDSYHYVSLELYIYSGITLYTTLGS